MKNVYILPGGYVDAHGALHQEVELTSPSGREEELLAERQSLTSPALITTLLSCCVRRIGTISPVSEDIARRLLVADRHYLLLKLREATFGVHVQATVQCAWADCSKKVDIDFSLQDIPVRAAPEKGPFHAVELSAEAAFRSNTGEEYREVSFRLPNGEDQEQISFLVVEDGAKALTMLLQRCIQRIGPLHDPGFDVIRWLSPLARQEIERHMEAVAPQVDLALEVNCPECNREFVAPFDLQEFFLKELEASLKLLYREVHYLAYHYHWSEREIMAMPREKRRKYIAVLAEEMER